jgi:hypothetical protein
MGCPWRVDEARCSTQTLNIVALPVDQVTVQHAGLDWLLLVPSLHGALPTKPKSVVIPAHHNPKLSVLN